MTLKDYIEQNHAGSQVGFARFLGVSKQQVNRMIKTGYIVVDGAVYSRRFYLPKRRHNG